MNKKLIFGLALALVLVSGGFFGAQANIGCACKDMTKNTITSQQSPATSQGESGDNTYRNGVLPNGLTAGQGNF